MDNHESVPPVKRSRLSDNINIRLGVNHDTMPLQKRKQWNDDVDVRWNENVNVLPAPESTSQSEAIFWKTQYNGLFQEIDIFELKHREVERKYKDLDYEHGKLQKLYENLLRDTKRNHVHELQGQREVTRFNEITVLKNAINRNLKMISDLNKQCDAYKEIINKFGKQNDETRQSFEEQKKLLMVIHHGELTDLKERYEKERARLCQIIDDYESYNMDRDQIIEQMKCQNVKAITTDLQRTREVEQSAPVKEKVAFIDSTVEAENKQKDTCNVHREDNKTVVLLDQKLTWEEFEKRVSTIKILNFVRVRVDKPNGDVASLEEILGKVPNIQMFGCVFGMDLTESIGLTNKTFVNLLMLQPFKRLRKFYLAGLRPDHFDVDCFLAFIKDHPKCKFYLSFHFTGKNKFKDIAKKLREAYPSKTKLVIDLLRSDLTVTHR